ncbi:MAG: c-type cytochrome [Sulfurospirillaceae bacterium]|nr:c-type cytochrome [Sulfurospirillaceae bacterium]
MKKLLLIALSVFALNAMAADSAEMLFKKCTACHGLNAEKKALGKSEIINKWDSKKIEAALNGYKKGTFGGAMKGIMKGQVANLNEAQIKTLAEYIPTLKK